jgi:3-oxoacyl-[acyl-carrier protein] reductase
VLVIGSSKGIGKAIVRTAMQEGANVAFTFLNSTDEAESIAEEMSTKYPERRCLACQCDIADAVAMEKTIKDLIAEFNQVEALVNNTGLRAMQCSHEPDKEK